MTSSILSKTTNENNCCYICDNYIFGKSIVIEAILGKIKLCSELCFSKYDIMIQQRQLKSKVAKVEKKEKSDS